MSGETATRSLDQVVRLRKDKESAGADSGLPYVGLEHLASGSPTLLGWSESSLFLSAKALFYKGDVLFGKLRPNLRKSLPAPFDGCCSTDILVLQPREAVDPSFAALVFQREEVFAEAVRTSEGTKMPRTSWERLKCLEVFAPSDVCEQHRIAHVIDSTHEAIAQTEALIAKLKQVKAGLVHELLTRGIDGDGQLRDPVAHPEQFRDTELGRIPREWDVRTLQSLSERITSGPRYWAAYYADEGPLFLRMGNLTREHLGLRLDDVLRVRPPRGPEADRTRAKPGDILISITADLGIIGVVPEALHESYVNQHIALVTVDSREACPRWVAYYLAHGSTQRQFARLNDLGAKAGMNLPSVGRLLVARPPGPEQEVMVGTIDALERSIDRESAYRDKLAAVKQGLMHDLLTGRVPVNQKTGVEA